MEKIVMVNPQKCTGCGGCELACSLGKEGEFGPAFARVMVLRFEDGENLPKVCVQCEVPACVVSCKVGALKKCDDGIIRVDESKCVGCKMCVKACPYGCMFFNVAKKLAIKCDTCDGDPMCVKYCPTAALEFVEDNGLRKKKKEIYLKAPKAEVK